MALRAPVTLLLLLSMLLAGWPAERDSMQFPP
jgi:hypothetical protein